MDFSKIKLQMKKIQKFEYNPAKVKTPMDVVRLVSNIEELNKASEEIVILIGLNASNEINIYSEIARGGMNLCTIDVKSIFNTLLISNVCRFILVHNHPSAEGYSLNDIKLTTRIQKIANMFEMEFLDYIVICKGEYISCFTDDGKIGGADE